MKIVKVAVTKIKSQPVSATKKLTNAERRAKREVARKMAPRNSFNPPKLEKPTNSRMKRRAKEMRRKPTRAEKRMCERLDAEQIAYANQQIIGWYIADILLRDQMLIIELDGQHHYTDAGSLSDFRRTQWLQQFGFKVIRCANEDVEKFDLSVLATYPLGLAGQCAQAVRKANKERNRALYYPPVQQERYKAKRKQKTPTEAWKLVPQIDKQGRIIK